MSVQFTSVSTEPINSGGSNSVCQKLSDETTKAAAANTPLRKGIVLRVTSAHPLSAASELFLSNVPGVITVREREVPK